MQLSDPLGDLVTRIRNGQRAGKNTIISPASKLRTNVLEVLKREGYIRGYSAGEERTGVETVTVELKYHDGQPVCPPPDVASIRRSRTCRGSTTGWAFPSCRRRAA